MNDAKRDNLRGMSVRLSEIKGQLEDLRNDLMSVRDEEQESFDNMPEGLQQSDNGQNIEAAANFLDEAVSAMDTAIDDGGVESAIDNIDEAVAL